MAEENGRAVVDDDVIQRARNAVGRPVCRREPIGGRHAAPGVSDGVRPAGKNREVDGRGDGQTAIGIGGQGGDGINTRGGGIPGIIIGCRRGLGLPRAQKAGSQIELNGSDGDVGVYGDSG